jgi:hypothetical protein
MGTTNLEASWRAVRTKFSSCAYHSYHARARKCVPAKPDAITVLDLTPLVFQRLVIHVGQRESERGSQKLPKVLLLHDPIY